MTIRRSLELIKKRAREIQADEKGNRLPMNY